MECKERNLIIRVWTLITRNLITRVLTIYHVNLAQSKALEQKRFALDRCRPFSITFGYVYLFIFNFSWEEWATALL